VSTDMDLELPSEIEPAPDIPLPPDIVSESSCNIVVGTCEFELSYITLLLPSSMLPFDTVMPSLKFENLASVLTPPKNAMIMLATMSTPINFMY
jgi:hypothetical protein